MAFIRQEGDLIAVPYGSNNIARGELVTVDASGKAKSGETGQKAFLGVAGDSTADVTSDTIRVWTEGAFQFGIASVAAADLGKAVAIASPTTVTTTTSGSTVIGAIVEIIGDKTVIVKLK